MTLSNKERVREALSVPVGFSESVVPSMDDGWVATWSLDWELECIELGKGRGSGLDTLTSPCKILTWCRQ